MRTTGPRKTHAVTRWRFATAVLAAGLLAAGCSSSGGSKSDSGGGAGKGSTFTVYFITNESGDNGSLDNLNKAMTATEKAIDARGGIKGHAIKWVTCDAQTNNNGAAACGQKAAAAHALMVISPTTTQGFFPYLEKAGIPVLTGGGAQADTSKVSFIMSDALDEASGGQVAALHQEGCKSATAIVGLGSNSELAAILTGGMKTEATLLGLDFKGVVSIPLNAPDVSAYAEQAVNKGGQCLIALDVIPTQGLALVKALVPLTKAGKIDKIGFATNSFQPSVLKAITPSMEALGDHAVPVTLIEDVNDKSNAKVQQYVADMKAGGMGDFLEWESAAYWAMGNLVVDVGNAIYPNVTPAAALKYLNGLKDYWPGVFPPVDFTKAVAGSPYGPRVFGAWVAVSKWTGGTAWPREAPFISLLSGNTNDNKSAKCPCG